MASSFLLLSFLLFLSVPVYGDVTTAVISEVVLDEVGVEPLVPHRPSSISALVFDDNDLAIQIQCISELMIPVDGLLKGPLVLFLFCRG